LGDRLVFVMDGPRLEAQALLLAASLAAYGPKDVARYAMRPKDSLQPISAATRHMLDACDVEICTFERPEAQWRKPYPHGNKLLACAALAEQVPASEGRTIFLDTDMICLGDFTEDMTDAARIYAVPEGVPTWGRNIADWQRAYDFFGLPLPQERVALTRRRRVESLPYFNAGLVSYPNAPLGRSGLGFAAAWLATASAFDHCPIAKKRPWLDQITLPLTLYREGFDWTVLPDAYNYSISGRSNERQILKSRMVHYHRAVYLAQVPKLTQMALEACYVPLPRRYHADLHEVLAIHFAPCLPIVATSTAAGLP
jgi:hypothetical protein